MWQVTWESDSRRPRQPREPSMTKNSSSSRARKIRAPWDSTPHGGVQKMAQNAPKKHPFRLKIVIELCRRLNLRHLHCSESENDRDVDDLVGERNCSALSGPWATVVHTSVNNLVQGLHCGISLLWHNWNVQHSVEGTESRRRTRTTWTAGRTRAA